MDAAGTVVGVVFVLFVTVIISTLAAVYLIWKDGCCKRREEEGDGERGELVYYQSDIDCELTIISIHSGFNCMISLGDYSIKS